MADYDSNLIKPVQSLQNVASVAPAKRRRDGSRRRQLPEKDQEQSGPTMEDDATPQERADKTGDSDNAGIDYCA